MKEILNGNNALELEFSFGKHAIISRKVKASALVLAKNPASHRKISLLRNDKLDR